MVAVAQRTRLARKAAGMAAFRRRTRIRGDNILCWGLIALLAVLVIYPLISLVYGSFDATGPDRETATFSLENRSEEHTSELQSLMRISYAVFCLKKTNTKPS